MKGLKKDYEILKSHKIKNGKISISYRARTRSNIVQEINTIEAEDDGGKWRSLYLYIKWEPFDPD